MSHQATNRRKTPASARAGRCAPAASAASASQTASALIPLRMAALCVAVGLGVVVAGPAVALSSDADEPIEIEADFAELDEQAGRTIYRGRVEVWQGSIHMTGDLLEADFDADQNLIKVKMTGAPAWFKQTPDNSTVDVEGEAKFIYYFKLDARVLLEREAVVTRGEQRFEGDRIDYDTERSVVKARALEPAAASPDRPAGAGRGRVRTIIPPKRNTPE